MDGLTTTLGAVASTAVGREPRSDSLVDRRARLGFSLIEACIATTVMTVAVGGLSAAIVSAFALQRTNQETATAQAAARRAMEQLRGVPFVEVFARHDANPANDVELLTVGLSYSPIPEVVWKLDYQDFENGADTGVDQLNVAFGYVF